MADTKAPRAGQSDAFKSGKVTYLSPLPPPTGLPPVDWLSAWRVYPARTNRFFVTGESWEHCSYEVLTSLNIIEEIEHLQLEFTRPTPKRSKDRVLSRELALLVKVEGLQPEGHYTESVYLLKAGPDSAYQIVPVQESPKGEIIWRRVTDPLMDMDIYA